MFQKLMRLYHTVKPLRFVQIYYRLVYRYFPLRRLATNKRNSSSLSWLWSGPEVIQPSVFGKTTVSFLNVKAVIKLKESWNDKAYEKLWLYNLHYFDDLNAIDSLARKLNQYGLVKRWIEENPPVSGNGWEPYPVSLRLINWIKWYHRAGINDQVIVDSIALQSKALTKQLEYHILGNHLFANAKALVFSGCFLEGAESVKCLNLGLKLLDSEIPEQFLEDGGHFELSPMYHCILLWDLLDLINLAKISGEKKLLSRLMMWQEYANKALTWLEVMTHSDSEISFFNDATIGIAASPMQIHHYAASLGLSSASNNAKLQTLQETGYSRINFPFYYLILDHGEVGPGYLPGHAHADTLSFELSIGDNRVFVNSGTSLYGLSIERQRQRGTAAHNTVVVESENSSEVWGGFRVAKRARVSNVKSIISDDNIVIAAQHDGYRRLKGEVVHTRECHATPTEIKIIDRMSVRVNAVAYYHVHPDITLKRVAENSFRLTTRTGDFLTISTCGKIEIEDATWHPGFGISVPNKRLSIPLSSNKLDVNLVIHKVN